MLQNLLTKAEETNTNLNALLDNLNQVEINLDIVNNEFMGLHNTQFIESRVYEDDEIEETNGADQAISLPLENATTSEQVNIFKIFYHS